MNRHYFYIKDIITSNSLTILYVYVRVRECSVVFTSVQSDKNI